VPTPLLVASDLDNPPFASVNKSGEPGGRDVEMMVALAEKLGRPIEWRRMAFEELLPAVEAGRVDVVCATLGITPERATRVDFSHPYYRTAIAVVARVGSGEPHHLADLVNSRLAADPGTTSERAVGLRLPKAKLVFEAPKGRSTQQRLLDGSVDAAVMDGPDADKLVAAANGRLVRLDEDLDQELYALALPKNRQSLLDRLNNALKELEKAGFLEQLNARHHLAFSKSQK
jgi:polar amino acid transport system substrate-binding protein